MRTDQSIVILTGAGISAESGLATFRGAGGLWENHPVEEVASLDGFRKNPELVQKFYNARRRQLLDKSIKPNQAHEALAYLERHWTGPFLLITQNVDDLHERAGSKKLVHMHGELLKARCRITETVFEWRQDILPDTVCACCGERGTLRPHIVWFGEMPMEMHQIQAALVRTRIFLSIGTSGQVYPAAGFVQTVPHEAHTVEFNAEETSVSDNFDEKLMGLAGQTVPRYVEKLIHG